MLDFIRGKLLRRSPMELVLDVGGIGFRIIVPMSTSMAVGAIGAESQSKTVELFMFRSPARILKFVCLAFIQNQSVACSSS